jgi:penicillin-binding protein 2
MDINKSIQSKYTASHKINIDTSYYRPIIEGMERTVRRGTAYKAYNKEVTLCGKTGTSQNPFGEDHSVFFGFAPKENPEIAIAVYIENAGFGGAVAAPIASLVVEKYLQGEVKRTYLEEKMKKVDLRKRTRS